MPLAPTLIAYFVVAAVLWPLGRHVPRIALALAVAPFAAQLVMVIVNAGDPSTTESYTWLPSLGVELAFRIDSLTLILTTIVAGIGLLIVVYSFSYFGDPATRHRFFSLMVLFSGAMAGLVASDDLFGLFVFWEITTIASFLLIGFDDEQAAARAAAVQAVLVTTAGGLAMLGGFVLLYLEAGTASISELVAAPPTGTIVVVALGLVFLGAFAKSAQFPFHFWLPGAMAAPTPASAYLHSATMVKAGIVLLLFLAPGFSNEPIWTVAVTGTGLITMSLGAMQAIRQDDMKLLLAHGTVSQLGFMTALLGLGLTGAALAVLIGHAAFKAALFLAVGVIDKTTGTRSLTRLGGLRRRAPILAITTGLVAASMAGIPPLLGFVTKEAAYDGLVASDAWFALTIIALASVVTVAYTARLWWGAFEGEPGEYDLKPRPAMLLGPPAVLAGLSLALGLWPAGIAAAVKDATGSAVKIVLWPGFTVPLAVSAAVLAAGALMYAVLARGSDFRTLGPWSRASAQGAYVAALRGLNRTADAVTGRVQSGSLPRYLAVIITTIVAVPGTIWLATRDATPSLPLTNGPAEIALGATAIAAAAAAARAQRRMAAALLLGAVGFAVAGIFITFGAPDLALTQLLIEAFTVALFAFVLARLPRRFGLEPESLSRSVRIAVSALAGAFVTGAAVLMTAVDANRDIAGYYIGESVPAGGRNVVNVILTDFRALDTLGEITVLATAAIGIGALVGHRVRKRAKAGS
jgi:multicomponent Na+:H+ antiporter subunit A